MKSRNSFYPVFLLALCICFYSCDKKSELSKVKENTDSAKINTSKTEVVPIDTLTIEEFCKICNDNIIKAEAHLLKKNILLKGYIDSIEKREGKPQVLLTNIINDEDLLGFKCFTLIQCLLDTSAANLEKAKYINKGQEISLTGTVTDIEKNSNIITAVIEGSILK